MASTPIQQRNFVKSLGFLLITHTNEPTPDTNAFDAIFNQFNIRIAPDILAGIGLGRAGSGERMRRAYRKAVSDFGYRFR